MLRLRSAFLTLAVACVTFACSTPHQGADSVLVDRYMGSSGTTQIGSNTLLLVNNATYPPEQLLTDMIVSDINAAQTGRVSFVRRTLDDFSGIEVGIGLGDPRHKLHLHNGPLAPFTFTPRPVNIALTNDATGRTTTDGLLVGIEIGGSARINQQEDLPLALATGGLDRFVIDANGRVGIGAFAPQATLHVGGAAGVDGIMFPDGTLQTTAATPGASLPSGVIVLWSGSTGSIPSGWALCNGQNGTPNLTDRFVVGAGNSFGVAQVGGSGSHTHLTPGTGGSGHLVDDNAGGTDFREQPSNHLPPYYALAYIMRL
jgi:hypothetical protein